MSCVYPPLSSHVLLSENYALAQFCWYRYLIHGPPPPRLARRRPLPWRSKTREITPSRPQFTPKPRWSDSNQRFQDDTRLYYSGFVTKNPIVVGSLSGKFFGVPLRLPESNRPSWEWITANNTLSSAIIISQWYSAFTIKISNNNRATRLLSA